MNTPIKTPEVTNKDFKTFFCNLSKTHQKTAFIDTEFTYDNGCDRYAMKIISIKRNGTIIETESLSGNIQKTFTWRKSINSYFLKGNNFGWMDFNRSENYRCLER